MKILKYIYIASIGAVLLASCRKTEAETVDINFTASNTDPSVGDTVTFEMSYGADALSIYAGDPGKDFAKSALLNLKKDDNLTQYIPTDTRYGVFNLDAKPLTSNPASITVSGTATLAPKTDSLILINSIGTTDNNELIIKPNIALYPLTVDPVISGVNLNRNLNMGIQLRGGNVSSQVTLRVTIKIDGVYTNATIANQRIDLNVTVPTKLDTIINIAPNIGTLADQWRASNPTRTYGPIEEIKIQIGIGPLNRFAGQFGIRSIALGTPIYIPWDVGNNVKYTVPNQPARFSYVYRTPGTYIATMVATSVGRKKFGPDGYIFDRANQIGIEEYDVDRQVKQIRIIVK